MTRGTFKDIKILFQVHLSDMATYADPVLSSLFQRGQELIDKLYIIKVKRQEFACIRFLTIFNPGYYF